MMNRIICATLLSLFIAVITVAAQAREIKQNHARSYSHLTEDLTWDEKHISFEALQALKAYTMFNLIQSQIRLESYLYCLNPNREPRSFKLFDSRSNNDEYMFSYDVTCKDALSKLYSEIYTQARKMRIHMAIGFGQLEAHGPKIKYDRNSKSYKVALNTQPHHLYEELPRVVPLSPDEIIEAEDILTKAMDTAVTNYHKKHPTNYKNHALEKNLREQALSRQIYRSFEEYKKTIEALPIIAFLKNKLDFPPSSLDIAVIRTSFGNLFQKNCGFLANKYLKPHINKQKDKAIEDLLTITPYANKKTIIDNTLSKLCKYEFRHDQQFKDYANIPWLTDFLASTNQAYRKEIFGLESSQFNSPNTFDVAKIDLDKVENTADPAIENLLKISGAKLDDEVKFPPFHETIESENLEFYESLLKQQMAIARLKQIPQWHAHGLVLEKMASNAASSEMWSDMRKAALFVGGGFLCQYTLKRMKPFLEAGNKVSKVFHKLISRNNKNGQQVINSEYCHLPFGIAGGLYFLDLENSRYQQSFDSFFASPFASEIIANFDQLEGARFAILLEQGFIFYDIYSLKHILPNPRQILPNTKQFFGNLIKNLKSIKLLPTPQSFPRGIYGQ